MVLIAPVSDHCSPLLYKISVISPFLESVGLATSIRKILFIRVTFISGAGCSKLAAMLVNVR